MKKCPKCRSKVVGRTVVIGVLNAPLVPTSRDGGIEKDGPLIPMPKFVSMKKNNGLNVVYHIYPIPVLNHFVA
jgi:hypothetical protein